MNNLTPEQFAAIRQACIKHLGEVDEDTRRVLVVRYGRWLREHDPREIQRKRAA